MNNKRKMRTHRTQLSNAFNFQKRCFVAGFVVTFIFLGTFVYAFGATHVSGGADLPIESAGYTEKYSLEYIENNESELFDYALAQTDNIKYDYYDESKYEEELEEKELRKDF